MVASKAAAQPTKRKKTEDMPDSPPKRVTRARAKASGDVVESKTKITKIVTTSAKVGSDNKRLAGSAKPAKTSKRNVSKGEDHNGDEGVPVSPEEPLIKELTKSARTRTTKAEEKEVTEKPPVVKDSAPSSRRGAKPPPVQKELHVEAPKPRGRPKKAVVTAILPSSDMQELAKPEPATKTGRGRAAATAAKSDSAASNVTAPARKRVKFQDDSEKEKENIRQVSSRKEPAPAKTGLKAKPVRKPAGLRTNTRSKKTQDEYMQTNQEEQVEEARPLSPKKVRQIAKSCSIGSEDELCRERTPVKALSKSPVKPPMSSFREMDKPASKLSFDDAEMSSSPTKSVRFTFLTSPARRPPPSPFKDSLRESPKRVNLRDSMAPVSQSAQSPTKATLLQSPAKRLGSPAKFMATGSPTKSKDEVSKSESAVAPMEAKQLNSPIFSSSKIISSPLRATRSPENPFKVCKMGFLEQERKPVAEAPVSPTAICHTKENPDHNLGPIAVPEEESIIGTDMTGMSTSPLQPAKDDDGEPPACGTTVSGTDCEETPMANTDVRSTTPPDPAGPFAAPSFSFASRLRLAAEESDSEDELVSHSRESKMSDIVPRTLTTTLPSKMTQGGFEWSPIPNASAQPFSMTPLATQLGGWEASSPEKTALTKPNERKRGLFSPFIPTFLDPALQGTGQCSSHFGVRGDSESPYKTSYFEDCFHPEITADQEEDAVDSFTCDVAPENADSNENLQSLANSQASDEYGDENALPMDLEGFDTHAQPDADDLTLTCTPATVFAPYPQEIHTVSKVPLRPAGDDSPLKMPKKRSRSLAVSNQTINGTETASTECLNHSFTNSNVSPLEVAQGTGSSVDEIATPTKSVIHLPRTPASAGLSSFGTPGRTVRKGLVPNVLKGAVVYVDVHTSEGADASGIFLDLLTQMGARCVKQWLWNPRSGDDSTGSASDSDGPGNKIGITHVVYKDGGKRTLEKVREAKGVVLCVGVGWVLEYVHFITFFFAILHNMDRLAN
jgi:hypothetical protein